MSTINLTTSSNASLGRPQPSVNLAHSATESPATAPTPERVMQLAWGFAPTLIIQSAIEFRIFDLLDRGAKTIPELAVESGASERGLRAILNALVGLNFLGRAGECYTLTPESAAFLVSSKPGYRGTFFRHTVHHLIPRWIQLREAVRTGKPVIAVNQENAGSEFFAEFVESLFPLSYPAARALAEHLGIRNGSTGSVLDIGAGSGVWGIGLAKETRHVRIHAVDWPIVLEVTRKVATQHGLQDRLTFSAGDLLQADFGCGHSVATIGHILHSEGPERSRRLLKRTWEALAPGGIVAIAEWVPNPDRTGPPGPLFFAVNMLVHTEQGDAFTFPEISGWLKEAGFKDPRLLDVPSPCPLILATK